MTDFFSRLFQGDHTRKKLWPSPKQDDSLVKPPTSPLDIEDEKRFRRPKIGLALSSGAAKGLAHIGVIQVLEENGIEVDAVAGSSMGAYVGALWAEGYNGHDLHEFSATVRTKMDALRLCDPVFPPRRGFVKGRKARARLLEALGDRQIEDLPKQLYIVATKLEYMSAKIFNKGPVVDAVHASIAIPGVCEPVTIDGVDYTDGGVANPLPVNVLKNEGIDRVIAVCVMPTAEELQFKKEQVRNTSPQKGFKAWLNKHFNYWAEGNLFNIQRRAEFGTQMRLAELSMQEADVRIRPIVCDAKWHDYASYEKFIKVGRQAAEANLDEIKTLCRPIEIEPDPSSKSIVSHN